MGLEQIGNFFGNLLTVKVLSKITNFIDEIDFALLRGLGYLSLFALIVWFLLYFLLWQSFYGHLTRNLVILGIWVIIEFAYFLGGGHKEEQSSDW